MSMKSRDVRTEPSLREFVQGCFDRESDSLAESKNRDITSGAMVAYQNVLAEIDRREAVPTVTLDGVFVADPAGLMNEINDMLFVNTGWDVDKDKVLASLKQIRAALGFSEGIDDV